MREPPADSESADRISDDGVSNVLVLGKAFAPCTTRACGDLLETGATGEGTVVLVSTSWPAAARLQRLQSRLDDDPAAVAVVRVDPDPGGSSTRGFEKAEADVTTLRTSRPGDLTEIGVGVTATLSRHPDTTLCLHSVTALLQYNSLEDVRRFLGVLATKVEESGAFAHYHLDPGAHDEETIDRLSSLFDRVVDAREGTDQS